MWEPAVCQYFPICMQYTWRSSVLHTEVIFEHKGTCCNKVISKAMFGGVEGGQVGMQRSWMTITAIFFWSSLCSWSDLGVRDLSSPGMTTLQCVNLLNWTYVNERKQEYWLQQKLLYKSSCSVGCYTEVLQCKVKVLYLKMKGQYLLVLHHVSIYCIYPNTA